MLLGNVCDVWSMKVEIISDKQGDGWHSYNVCSGSNLYIRHA